MTTPRTLRIRSQRAALYYSQHGKCAICGERLLAGWHADHVTPWVISQVTSVHKMQALCSACNLKKGSRVLTEDRTTEGAMRLLRPWQRETVKVCDSITPFKRNHIIRAVPAAGKGSVPYLVLGHAPRSMVTAACHVVPRLNLRDQSESVSPWLANYFSVAGLRLPRMRRASNVTPFRREADGYSICWNSIEESPDMHYEEFENERYALIIDEPQMLMDEGATARKLAPLIDRAACLFMMSGTFMRGDRKRIPFLPYKQSPDGEVIDYEADGWTTIRYSRRDALRDHAIIPIEFVLRDARAKFVKGGVQREFGSFAELENEEDQRAGLFAVLIQDGGWQIAREMLDSWAIRRKSLPSSQALIITHSQPAAREYSSKIKQSYPDADVRIAISDMPESNKTLNRFRGGRGDVLITVGMAYVGFDAPNISHIALLTYVRQPAWIEQAISRGARVADGIPYTAQRCIVFAPSDPLLRGIIREIEAEQEAAVVEEIVGGRKDGEPPERQQTVVIDVALTETQAHELNVASLSPELTARCARALADNGMGATPVQLLHAINSAFGVDAMPYSQTAPLIGIGEQEDLLASTIEKRCRATDARMGFPFGAVNEEMIRHTNLPRRRMSVAQLAKALDWLDRTYPLPGQSHAA